MIYLSFHKKVHFRVCNISHYRELYEKWLRTNQIIKVDMHFFLEKNHPHWLRLRRLTFFVLSLNLWQYLVVMTSPKYLQKMDLLLVYHDICRYLKIDFVFLVGLYVGFLCKRPTKQMSLKQHKENIIKKKTYREMFSFTLLKELLNNMTNIFKS